jgi:hypothetical protein
MPDVIQEQEISRVRERISALVLAFCRDALASYGGLFRMAELLAFVRKEVEVAPDSPGRILRDLRRKTQLDYKVLSRRESSYCVLWVCQSLTQGELFN